MQRNCRAGVQEHFFSTMKVVDCISRKLSKLLLDFGCCCCWWLSWAIRCRLAELGRRSRCNSVLLDQLSKRKILLLYLLSSARYAIAARV